MGLGNIWYLWQSTVLAWLARGPPAAFANLRDLRVHLGLSRGEAVCSEGVGSGSIVTFHGTVSVAAAQVASRVRSPHIGTSTPKLGERASRGIL